MEKLRGGPLGPTRSWQKRGRRLMGDHVVLPLSGKQIPAFVRPGEHSLEFVGFMPVGPLVCGGQGESAEVTVGLSSGFRQR